MILRKLIPLLVFIMLISPMEGCATASNPTKIPAVSSTTTEELVPTPALTSTANSPLTPTYFPTLSVDDARRRFSELLATNGDCLLPCFLGITPDTSTFQEATTVLVPLSSISDRVTLESGYGFFGLNYTESESGVYTSVSFLADPNTNIVSSIAFHAQALREISLGNYEDLFDDPLYDHLMKTYSLSQILSTYGLPAEVLIRTNSGPPPQNWGPFEMLLPYPELGVLVHYTMPMKQEGVNVLGCPQQSKLEMDLSPAGVFASTEELLAAESAPLKIEDIFPGFRPIEEVTSLTMDNFAQKFSQPTDECIETPANYWPEP